jgi:hypothetical protein
VIVSSNRPWLAALELAAGLVSPAPAIAEPDAGAIAVHWAAPGECERGERARRRIAIDLGERTPGERVDVDVRVQPDGEAWRAMLELRGPTQAQRTIVARDCDALADGVALVVVVALDPFALGRAARTRTLAAREEAALARAEPPSDDAPPAQVERAPSRRGTRLREPVHAALRAELGASAFALPGIGVLVGIAPVVDGDRWRVEVPVRWSLPREQNVREGVGGRLQLVAAGPRGCWVPGRRTVGVPLCAGLEAGAMIGRGRGDALVRTDVAATRWLAATLSVAVRWRVHRRFATWLAIEGIVPFGRPAFHVVRDGDVFQSRAAAVLVALGAELHFPSSSRPRRRTQPSGGTRPRASSAGPSPSGRVLPEIR